MVSTAYTADHINRSSCDLKKDKNLADAYSVAWNTALVTGLGTGAIALIAAVYLAKSYKKAL